jgi:hypothetical protein
VSKKSSGKFRLKCQIQIAKQMSDTIPDIDTIYHRIQVEFDGIDKQLGNRRKRRMAITELPQLARDLYLVHDIVAIACDSGTGAWIHYHHDEPGWIDGAVEAFARIGHSEVGDGIRSCLAVYLSKGGSITSEDDVIPSDYIIDHEHEIMRSLYTHLLKHSFVFQSDDE